MEIINMPIAEYLKLCKEVAYERGFVWVMVLLARERDAVHSYNDLKQYWNSFDDLTGDKILFILSIANRREESYSNYPAHEIEEWRRLYNPNLLVMNQRVPTVSRWKIPSDENIQKYRNMAIENNTHFITDLCNEFGISEKQVPSIVLFRTDSFERSYPIVVPINSDNLYMSIKDFITFIEPGLKNFGKHRTMAKNITIELKEIESSILQNEISSPERRYVKAKWELLHAIETGSMAIDISMLLKAIKKRDIHACDRFPQPVRGYLNQMIDLQREYNGIENNSENKTKYEQLYAQQVALKKAQVENWDLLEKSRYDLDFAINRYVSEMQKKSNRGEKRMNIRVPHFKIGITFSGKYRKQFVEPFCNALLDLGYTKEEIFYDAWHEVLINGVHGDSILRQIYSKNCDCIVVLISPDYKDKNWTGHIEWPAVKELINTGDDGKVCLLRVGLMDIGEIDGLYQNQSIAKAIDNMSATEIADFIDSKYKILASLKDELNNSLDLCNHNFFLSCSGKEKDLFACSDINVSVWERIYAISNEQTFNVMLRDKSTEKVYEYESKSINYYLHDIKDMNKGISGYFYLFINQWISDNFIVYDSEDDMLIDRKRWIEVCSLIVDNIVRANEIYDPHYHDKLHFDAYIEQNGKEISSFSFAIPLNEIHEYCLTHQGISEDTLQMPRYGYYVADLGPVLTMKYVAVEYYKHLGYLQADILAKYPKIRNLLSYSIGPH